MRRTILTLVLLFLMIETVLAQEIDVTLISYDSESQKARLRVENIANTDIHDISLRVDNQTLDFPGSLLKPGTAIILTKNVLPGNHIISISTKDGIGIEKEILFPIGESILKEKLGREREIKSEEGRAQKGILEEQIEEGENVWAMTKRLITRYYIHIIISSLFILLAISLFLSVRHYKKKRAVKASLPLKKQLTQQVVKKKMLPTKMPIITTKPLDKGKERENLFAVFEKKPKQGKQIKAKPETKPDKRAISDDGVFKELSELAKKQKQEDEIFRKLDKISRERRGNNK